MTKAKLKRLERRLERRPKSFEEVWVVQLVTSSGKLLDENYKIIDPKSLEYAAVMKAREGKNVVSIVEYYDD